MCSFLFSRILIRESSEPGAGVTCGRVFFWAGAGTALARSRSFGEFYTGTDSLPSVRKPSTPTLQTRLDHAQERECKSQESRPQHHHVTVSGRALTADVSIDRSALELLANGHAGSILGQA